MRHVYLFHKAFWLLCLVLLAACGAAPSSAPTTAGRALPLRNDVLSSVDLVGKPELFDTPWDAAPDPQGKTIYFTATGSAGSGVFSVPTAGGETKGLATGAPFVAPRGLAISTDGRQIYVADPQAAGGEGRAGSVFVLPTGGGAPTMLAGTAGTAPRGVEVANEGGADVLYFSGTDPASGEPAVMKVATTGTAAPSVVAKGVPLVEPVGIAITKAGVVYVADRLASGNNLGSVFRITAGKVELIADKFRAGSPVVGAALTMDESSLLVSAIDTARDSAQVLLIQLSSLEQAIVNKVIEANAGSGGIHRAYDQNVFAWAGIGGPRPGGGQAGQGGVYAIKP